MTHTPLSVAATYPLLAMVDDNVTWQPVIGAGKHVPTSGARKGKASVGEFFKILGQSVSFTTFEPREFIAQNDKVVCLVYTEATVRDTGRAFVSHEAQVWTFRDGKLARFQNYLDTAAADAAHRAE